jgi:hypothetical protein
MSGLFIHNQLRHLVKVGCQIKVVSPVPYAPKILWWNRKWKGYGMVPQSNIIDGIPVYYPRYLCLPRKWFYGFSCYALYYGINKLISSIITEFTPQVIYTYTATPDGYAGLKLENKYGIPHACSFRGSDINIYPNYDRLTFHLTRKVVSESNQIFTVSKALKVISETIGKPKKEIQVVYNGCDTEAFLRNKEDRFRIRKQLDISLNGKVIIFVGSLSKNKGVHELMDVFVSLIAEYSDLHLILIGDGPEYNALAEMVHSNSLDKKVHLVGSKPHREIPKWLSAADIFVLPTYYEGLPNVVIEAMACSLPVVATRVGGIPEAVIDGQTGLLVDAKDTEQLKAAMERMITDDEFRASAGREGLAHVHKKFDPDHNAKKLADALHSLAKEQKVDK